MTRPRLTQSSPTMGQWVVSFDALVFTWVGRGCWASSWHGRNGGDVEDARVGLYNVLPAWLSSKTPSSLGRKTKSAEGFKAYKCDEGRQLLIGRSKEGLSSVCGECEWGARWQFTFVQVGRCRSEIVEGGVRLHLGMSLLPLLIPRSSQRCPLYEQPTPANLLFW